MTRQDNYQKTFAGDSESLDLFMGALAKFDRRFCEAMHTGVDFTLKMEIHGNDGQLLHARVLDDSFSRPKGKVEKKPRNRLN